MAPENQKSRRHHKMQLRIWVPRTPQEANRRLCRLTLDSRIASLPRKKSQRQAVMDGSPEGSPPDGEDAPCPAARVDSRPDPALQRPPHSEPRPRCRIAETAVPRPGSLNWSSCSGTIASLFRRNLLQPLGECCGITRNVSQKPRRSWRLGFQASGPGTPTTPLHRGDRFARAGCLEVNSRLAVEACGTPRPWRDQLELQDHCAACLHGLDQVVRQARKRVP